MKVSGTARPTVAPAPCGLMLTARLAPIAAMESEIAPQVVSVRRSAGACESVEGPLVAVMCFAPPRVRGLPGAAGSRRLFSDIRTGDLPAGGRQSTLAARLTET